MRRVRDYLETKHHHPLLFFLKCIRETDELDSLITREIEARTFFLLCDSPNSRSARWVQREVEYIRSLSGRHYEVVDLQAPWPEQQVILDRISQRGTLFLLTPVPTHRRFQPSTMLCEPLTTASFSTGIRSRAVTTGAHASSTRSTSPSPRAFSSTSSAQQHTSDRSRFSLPSLAEHLNGAVTSRTACATSFQFSSATVPHLSSCRRALRDISFSIFGVSRRQRRQSAFTRPYAASPMNPTATPNHALQLTASRRTVQLSHD